tara:strand:+ start:576 stop:701 length:126 start_codon:yes stop_codon:yes gene_type:complete
MILRIVFFNPEISWLNPDLSIYLYLRKKNTIIAFYIFDEYM